MLFLEIAHFVSLARGHSAPVGSAALDLVIRDRVLLGLETYESGMANFRFP